MGIWFVLLCVGDFGVGSANLLVSCGCGVCLPGTWVCWACATILIPMFVDSRWVGFWWFGVLDVFGFRVKFVWLGLGSLC